MSEGRIVHSVNEELDYDSKDTRFSHELDVLRYGKRPEEVETRTFKMMNDSWTMSAEIIGNGGLRSSIFEQNQEDSDTMQATTRSAVGSKRGFGVPSVPSEHDSSFKNYNFLAEGTSKNPLKWRKTYSCANGKDSVLKPLDETTYVGLSSQVPYKLDLEKFEFHQGKSKISSLISKDAIISNRQLQNAKLGVMEHEICSKNIHSTKLVCDRKMDGSSRLDNSVNGWYRERNNPFLFNIPSTSDHCYTTFNQEFISKMQKHSRLCLPPDQCIGSGNVEKKKSFYDCYSQNNLQNFHSVSPLKNQGKGGVIIQPLSSSTDSEGERNAGNAKISKVTINNESSAETDSMNVEFFRAHSGANSTPSEKALKMDVTSKEAESHPTYTKLPDINLELPALSAEAKSSEDLCPSSSKTQSLEMEVLVAHSEQLPKPKSSIFPDNSSHADPSNIWVKRLKLNSSHSFAESPNNSNISVNMSSQKREKQIGKISGSEPTARKGKESMVSDKTTNLSEDNEDVMVDSSNKNKKLILSDGWIQRWLHNGSRISPKRDKTIVVSEAQSPILVLEDLEKRQFPSIGAMALMGRAMRGLQPCDYRRKGPFTFWDTKAA